jgi:hypothetical protein
MPTVNELLAQLEGFEKSVTNPQVAKAREPLDSKGSSDASSTEKALKRGSQEEKNAQGSWTQDQISEWAKNKINSYINPPKSNGIDTSAYDKSFGGEYGSIDPYGEMAPAWNAEGMGGSSAAGMEGASGGFEGAGAGEGGGMGTAMNVLAIIEGALAVRSQGSKMNKESGEYEEKPWSEKNAQEKTTSSPVYSSSPTWIAGNLLDDDTPIAKYLDHMQEVEYKMMTPLEDLFITGPQRSIGGSATAHNELIWGGNADDIWDKRNAGLYNGIRDFESYKYKA